MSIQFFQDITVSYIRDSWFLLKLLDKNCFYLYNNESCEIGRVPYILNQSLSNVISKIITTKKIEPKLTTSPKDYLFEHKGSPPRLMLFLTASCNLKCVYCHCNSHDKKAVMDDKIAIKIVDKYIKYIHDFAHDKNDIEITFMGGGEPFLQLNLIKKIVTHVNDTLGLPGKYVLVTNGTLGTESDWEWLIKQGFRITISVDGPPNLHDQYRKFASGILKTSEIIEKRLRFLSQRNANVNIRTTVLKYDSESIKSICEYFKIFSCVKTHHLEPVSLAGRALSINLNNNQFLHDFFINYAPYLYQNPKRYKSAWFKPFKKSYSFCGAVYFNVVVTHDGYVSICSEVDSSMINTTYGKKYIVSHINDENPFLSFKSIEFSNNNSIDKFEECKNCIIRYKCGGGCYIKRDRDFKTNTDFYNAYCKNSILLNMSYLINLYENEKNDIPH